MLSSTAALISLHVN